MGGQLRNAIEERIERAHFGRIERIYGTGINI
jgi:hypothetical protein